MPMVTLQGRSQSLRRWHERRRTDRGVSSLTPGSTGSYGIVGDSLNPIVDAVRKTGGSKKGGIDWIHVRHEEAAARSIGRSSAHGQARRVRGLLRPGQPAPHPTACTTRTARAHPSWPSLAHPERSDRHDVLPGDSPGPHFRGVLGLQRTHLLRGTVAAHRELGDPPRGRLGQASRSSHCPATSPTSRPLSTFPPTHPRAPRRLLPMPPTLKRPQPS